MARLVTSILAIAQGPERVHVAEAWTLVSLGEGLIGRYTVYQGPPPIALGAYHRGAPVFDELGVTDCRLRITA